MRNDHLYLELAERQRGLVLHRQLLELGFSHSGVTRRRRAGMLRDVARGLYALPGVPLEDHEVRLAAAVLRARHLAAASHVSAARMLDLKGVAAASQPHLTVARASDPHVRGVIVHRSEILDRFDIVEPSAAIPVVRPERAVIGIAQLHPARAEAAIDRAVLNGHTTIDRLWRYLTRFGGPGCPGSGPVKAALLRRDPRHRPLESDLERAWVAVLARHGLTGWVPQHEVRTDGGVFRIDLAHPSERLGVEFDSRLWHSSEDDYRRERRKRYSLARAGYRLFPVTEFDLHERADEIAADLLLACGSLRQAQHPAA